MRLVLLLLFTGCLAFAQPSAPPNQPSAIPAPKLQLTAGDAIILGVVEGVTEFLPISSTGHLIIATQALGLDSDAPLLDENGEQLWHKRPSERSPGELLTVKLAADTFTVVIQFGAIAAVALLYWKQVVAMLLGLFGRDPAGLRLLINLVVAFLPAAIVGFLAHNWISEKLFSIQAVIVAQVVGALIMFAAERWRRQNAPRHDPKREPSELSVRAAAGIGLLQCVALWPGMSRSMTTIVGGYFAGLDPRRSAEFSFLLGLITLSAAALFKGYKSGSAMIAVFGWPHILLGCFVAAISAAVAVKFLVAFLSRSGLTAFAFYRLGVGAVLTAWFYF